MKATLELCYGQRLEKFGGLGLEETQHDVSSVLGGSGEGAENEEMIRMGILLEIGEKAFPVLK